MLKINKRVIAYSIALTLLLIGAQVLRINIFNMYLDLGNIVVVIAAFSFGPIIGGFVGGLGYALSDCLLGWFGWAFYSLIIRSAQGATMGYIIYRNPVKDNKSRIIALICGGFITLIGYYVTEVILYGSSYGYTIWLNRILIPEMVNLMIAGIIGVPISIFIERRTTPIVTGIPSQQIPIPSIPQQRSDGKREIAAGIILIILFYATLNIRVIPAVWIGALIAGIINIGNGLWKYAKTRGSVQRTPIAITTKQKQEEPRICPICGWSNPSGFIYCGKCGNILEDDSTRIY